MTSRRTEKLLRAGLPSRTLDGTVRISVKVLELLDAIEHHLRPGLPRDRAYLGSLILPLWESAAMVRLMRDASDGRRDECYWLLERLIGRLEPGPLLKLNLRRDQPSEEAGGEKHRNHLPKRIPGRGVSKKRPTQAQVDESIADLARKIDEADASTAEVERLVFELALRRGRNQLAAERVAKLRQRYLDSMRDFLAKCRAKPAIRPKPSRAEVAYDRREMEEWLPDHVG